MLTEDQVVEAVIAYLRDAGWRIESFALATSTGDDIVATCGGRHLYVEAKGGGSSKEGTRRFGSPFNSGQVLINVGMATYRAMCAPPGSQGAAAFPDTAHYRARVAMIAHSLARLDIAVFFVSPDETVSVEIAELT